MLTSMMNQLILFNSVQFSSCILLSVCVCHNHKDTSDQQINSEFNSNKTVFYLLSDVIELYFNMLDLVTGSSVLAWCVEQIINLEPSFPCRNPASAFVSCTHHSLSHHQHVIFRRVNWEKSFACASLWRRCESRDILI